MKKIALFVIITVVVISCKKESGTPWNGVAGKFSMGLANHLKSAKAIQTDGTVTFDLDSLKSSRSFYFILGNVGENDITNISLSSDNSNFNITPSTIEVLPGTKSKNSSTLIQIISLDIVHGTRINGVGYTKLLSAGDNYGTITIQGHTRDSVSDISTSIKAAVKVYAKVMDIALFQGSTQYDLTQPAGKFIGSLLFDVDQSNSYEYSALPMSLKNTGNVGIQVTVAALGATNTVLQNVLVNPQQSINLNLPAPLISTTLLSQIQLNSGGTIFDQQKLSMGNDGNAYFGMSSLTQNGSTPPPSDTVKNN